MIAIKHRKVLLLFSRRRNVKTAEGTYDLGDL